MSRCRILFDRHGKLAEYQDGELVWVREEVTDAPTDGPQVIRDLQPYRSMIDGSVIDGRKRHRDHLRAHGCIEVGNDTSHMERKPIPVKSHKEALHRVLADVSDRQLAQMIQREIRNRK
ncbi:MAG TPA: hypothetical protein VGR76_00535 [Candidatus Angelobacter sp.]|jgi:hypothetical protein|nr:hypothetical protein [Candidatus Angelobacter sp.]